MTIPIDPNNAERGLIERFLDPDALLFVDAFARIIPKARREDIVHCLLWSMSGIFYFYLSFEDRYARLSGQPLVGQHGQESYEALLDYSVAGWLKLAHAAETEPA